MYSKYVEEFNQYLNEQINSFQNNNSVLKESMKYSLEAGGKRFRPVLMVLIANAIGLDYKKVFDSGIAIEMIHTFSLIHDDLPCMDDDDLRRGKPTNHKVYGEDIALLAGDNLNTIAFNYILKTIDDNKIDLELGYRFTNAISKMIEGQVLDMDINNHRYLDYIVETHKNKTGALIEFSIIAPLLIKKVDKELIENFEKFAYHIGLSFQIKDDILDCTSNSETLGKSTSDAVNNKNTYVSLLGLERANEYLDTHINESIKILKDMNMYTEELAYLCEYSKNRKK